jgi:hypothetical protein
MIPCEVCKEKFDHADIYAITRPDWADALLCRPCAKDANYTTNGLFDLRMRLARAGKI